MLEPAGAFAPTRSASMRERIAMYNDNTLKIGIFGANCSSGRSATKVPERWSASWPDCLRLARMADDAGIDFMLPIGRWKGYGGDTDFHGTTLETITWATGLLGATEAPHGVRHGARAAVSPADRRQGVRHRRPRRRRPLRAQSRGWAGTRASSRCSASRSAITTRATTTRRSGSMPSSAPGASRMTSISMAQFVQAARSVRAKPKPYGGTRPLIMNAGSSPVGQAFALRNCDAFFTATSGSRTSLEATRRRSPRSRPGAQRIGREIEVYTVGQVICRPTQKEAEDYYRHAIIENADWGAIDGMLAIKNITPQTLPPEEYAAKRRYFAAQRDRRLSVRRHARPGRGGAFAHQPGRRARHRALLRQLSAGAAVLLRRGAASAGTSRHAREAPTKPERSPSVTRRAHAASAFDPATKDRLITLDRAEAECASLRVRN